MKEPDKKTQLTQKLQHEKMGQNIDFPQSG
jgi:hypothetical protein